MFTMLCYLFPFWVISSVKKASVLVRMHIEIFVSKFRNVIPHTNYAKTRPSFQKYSKQAKETIYGHTTSENDQIFTIQWAQKGQIPNPGLESFERTDADVELVLGMDR